MVDSFDKFSVFFTTDSVYVSGKRFPLGQLTTDILNLDDVLILEIDRRITDFLSAAAVLFTEKTDSAARSTQEKLNAAWDLVFELPLYRELAMDLDTARHLFLLLFADREKWDEVLDVDSEGHVMLEGFLARLAYLSGDLDNFRGQISGMLELYFEPLKRRGAEAYAEAFARSFAAMDVAGRVLFDVPFFEQSFPVEVKFVPMAHPTEREKVILAEKAAFSNLSHFLYTDFYRGLMAGNAPRCCHNCGRYFLLTEGYNTCYCGNIAPGETERTCRKVGAHRKEAKGRAAQTPEQKEFRKAYNRLKQRKNRKKISVDEWNAAVAEAMKVLERAEQGKLDDEEMRKRFAEL